jgi:peptide/nickel transport system substrate-binding protein
MWNNMFTRRRVIQVATAGLCALGFAGVAGCGGSSTSTGKGAPTGTGAPQRGGILRFAVTDASTSEKLDPALAVTTNDSVYGAEIFEGLVETDLKFKPRPALATDWSANASATKWTFNLRDGVKFQDGTPLTAKDVVFSLRRIVDKSVGSPGLVLLGPLLKPAGIRAKDDHTVVFDLQKPTAILPVILAQRHMKIVKDGTKDFTVATAIGTGPFKLKSWKAGVSWSVVRNPSYWESGKPYLDGIEAVVIPDQSTKVQSVVSGRNDFSDGIDFSLFSTVESSGKAELKILPYNQGFGIIFDRNKAPFTDERVFRAVQMAQDRQQILTAGIQSKGHVTADVPVATDDPYYPASLSLTQDIEGAKRLLAEAGFPDGIDIDLNTSAVAPGMVEVAQAFQQTVKAAGIRVKVKQSPTSSYYSKVWMKTPVFMDYFSHYHPIVALTLYYASDAVWNESAHKDPELDRMITKAVATLDEKEQQVATQKAYARAAATHGYAMPALGDLAFVQKRKVQGVMLDYNNRLFFKAAWLSR